MRDTSAGAPLLKQAEGLSGQIEVARLDITDPGNFSFPDGLAVLVNNAGVRLSYLPAEHSPEDEWRKTFETNVFGLAALLRRAIPVMRQAGAAVICNITSAAILTPVPFFSVYRASKAAASAISDSLAVEVAPLGIRVLEILPGPIDTELLRTSALYRPLDAVNYPAYEPMAAQSVADPNTSVVTSAHDAAIAIVDAITADGGDLRQGCDPVSRMLLQAWRTSSDQELLTAMQARYAGGTDPSGNTVEGRRFGGTSR
jgi:NAD(P)-dependent dehydrogenase (short-subunit alcohol dehydrogenase family)